MSSHPEDLIQGELIPPEKSEIKEPTDLTSDFKYRQQRKPSDVQKDYEAWMNDLNAIQIEGILGKIHEGQTRALYPAHPEVEGAFRTRTENTCPAGRGKITWEGGERADLDDEKHAVVHCNNCDMIWQ